ncbi:hypothetical protein DYB28_006553 [Aphanomyces astaci]|uniref:START domain-containing protein n=1 Tax=Aphanomyces astaci TaxID=112090 RepID=A0A9X8H9K1_APHAT|nr:hypothetical protein DYB28_006553 [Aphanomyces astaci]
MWSYDAHDGSPQGSNSEQQARSIRHSPTLIMQHRVSTFSALTPAESSSFKRGHHLVDQYELEYLTSLTHRTFQDCVQTALALLTNDPTIAKHITRPHATFHHERIRLRTTVDAFSSSFLRRVNVDESYASQMGFSNSHLLIDLTQHDAALTTTSPPSPSRHHAGFRWAGLPSSLAVISDRDFCGLERADSFVDASGRLGWAYTLVSMEHACCPSLPNYVRGWTRLTHLCVPSVAQGCIDVLSFVHADFRGNTPQFVARQVLKQLVKDAHGTMQVVLSALPRRRKSSASQRQPSPIDLSDTCLDTSRTWTLAASPSSSDHQDGDADGVPSPPQRNDAAKPASQPTSVFRAMANALVDPESPLMVLPPSPKMLLPTTCSTCLVAAPFAKCHVCDAVSCHICSAAWCVVHKYQANVILCDSPSKLLAAGLTTGFEDIKSACGDQVDSRKRTAPTTCFGTSSRPRDAGDGSQSPGPGAYQVPTAIGKPVLSTMKTAAACSISGREKFGSTADLKSAANCPGPGDYSPHIVNPNEKTAPQYSLGKKWSKSVDGTNRSPGPGAYETPESLLNTKTVR